MNGATTYLTILDARTGARVYETNFKAAPPPGGSKTRVASWGYSPDESDRTFVYAYVSSQTVSSVFWGVVNLQHTPNKLVHSELLVNAIPSGTILPFWKFSPCGDAIGLVTPPNIRLFATSDGALKVERNITTSGTLTLKVNLTSHYVDTGSATYTLTDNTADAACTVLPVMPELVALSITPASVLAGSTTARGTVTLSQPAPSGGVVVSLGSSVPSVAQVPSSVRVLAGDSTFFEKVIVVGHSMGSFTAIDYAGSFPGQADGIILTGFLHDMNWDFVFGSLVPLIYPATFDPKFLDQFPNYDYLTTWPGSRGDAFYYLGNVDPEVLALDESLKQTATSGEFGAFMAAVYDPISLDVEGPVLLVVGQYDYIFCGGLVNCSDKTAVQTYEEGWFSASASVETAVINDVGHDLNLQLNADAAYSKMLSWADRNVGRTYDPAP